MIEEVVYKLPLKEFLSFLRGRSVTEVLEDVNTPDGPGYGWELNGNVKVLLVSQFGADPDVMPSLGGISPMQAKKLAIWVYETPSYSNNCPGCKFLGSQQHFNTMTCDYKFVELYICIKGEHKNDDECPTFLARLSEEEGDYYFAQSYRVAQKDSLLSKAVVRAEERGLFKLDDYPNLKKQMLRLNEPRIKELTIEDEDEDDYEDDENYDE